jgi:hypothetical protein
MRSWYSQPLRSVASQVRGWHVSLFLAVVCAVSLFLTFRAHADPTPTTFYANLSGVTWINTTCPDGTNSDSDGFTCDGHF